MDKSKAEQLLKSLDFVSSTQPTNDTSYRPISKILTRISKPVRQKITENSTINYFRSISSRRVKSRYNSELELIDPEKSQYQPFSKTKLYQRIATFQKISNWSIIQNNQLNPLNISLKGWKCDLKSQNTIICEVCKNRFHIKLVDSVTINDEELEENVNIELISKYLEKLTTGHTRNCPWRKQSCPLSIYEIQFKNLSNVLDGLKKDYLDNLKYASDKDILEFKVLPVLEPDQLELINKWMKKEQMEFNEKIGQITIFGWKFAREGNLLFLKSESDSRRLLINSEETIDLLSEHSDWSSYVEGYKVIFEILKTITEQSESYNYQEFEVSDDEDEYNDIISVTTVDNMLERLDNLKKSIL